MPRRFHMTLAIACVLGLVGGAVAWAAPTRNDDDGAIDSPEETASHDHGQHGGLAGHLPAGSSNVTLVGQMRVNQDQEGRVSDVGVFGNYAYLGAYSDPKCQKGGVYVFNISNPAAPKQVNFVRTANNSYVSEGVQVLHVSTSAYDGDLLVHSNETCGTAKTGAVGGISLVDVTNPKVHKYLARGVGDFDPESSDGPGVAHSVHSAFAWDAGDKAYVVLVDNEEARDVDIMDITNPRAPVLIAEYDLNTYFPQILDPTLGDDESFLHDMVVEQIGVRFIMLLSYWDGGYVTMDVTNPTAATYVGDTDFTNPDPEASESGLTVKPEGNAHQAEFSMDNNYIVAADEDFSPYFARGTNVSDGGQFATTQGSNTPQVTEASPLQGQTKFGGRACPGDPAVPAGDGTQIAVVERGVCLFTEKVAAVEAAGGYVGVIIFNREGSDACSNLFGMSVEGDIPALAVARDVGYGFFDQEADYNDTECRAQPAGARQAPIALGKLGDTVRIDAGFDGWGYVHLFRNGAGKLTELDTYAIPQAHDRAFASGFGDLSVHEVAMSERVDDIAYFSYYAAGFRVARVVGDELVETGFYIAPGGNNFWGVQVWQKDGKEYVLASDRDYGLFIFQYTGPGAPTP